MKPSDVRRAVERSDAARRTVDAVERRVRRYAGDAQLDTLSARDVAVRIVADVMSRQRNNGEGPPWKPPRYPMPPERYGSTKRLLIHDIATGQDVKVYMQANLYQDGRPAEMFVSKQADASTVGALLDALATAISIGLQHGVPWETYMRKLIGHGFPPYGWTEERDPAMAYVKSILDSAKQCHDEELPQGGHDDTCDCSSGESATSNSA
jgi:hypothetical protein